jgi:quercetin dioxygenase-like cupin family protein
MTDEILFQHGTTLVRRLHLAPGEAMAWHRDPFHRVAVVLGGDVLLIEYRDGGESLRVKISPGQVDWEEPSARVHRAVNVGKQPYEQVTVFLLDHPDSVAQPCEE